MLTLLPALSTSFIAISAILVAIGWSQVAKRKFDAHKKTMIFASVFALAFFIIYMSRTIFVGNMNFGGPDELRLYYQIFLIFHITLATTAAVFGLVTLYLGFTKQFSKHRKWGPVTSIIWFGTAITGIAVYFLLFVIYPGGETSSLLRTILGF
ncbi:DUF420 domain-containing protein [Brevibacterium sp. JNUCC-42]|nr:DUF420 domain-containing protein [Brevibacterium sp. JNUCC-42]